MLSDALVNSKHSTPKPLQYLGPAAMWVECAAAVSRCQLLSHGLKHRKCGGLAHADRHERQSVGGDDLY